MASTAGAVRAGRAFIELFADDSKLVRGLKMAERKLRAFGQKLRQVGTQLAMTGVAAAVPFALAAKTFASFESQMARVLALTNATEQDFARLEAKAKELGASTVFSASQAAEAMSFFALAGFNVDQILTAIGPTLDLAAAGQIEIAESADIAAKIMAGMGIEAAELGGVVDVLAKAMTTANTDLLMLGDAFKFVGPMAKSAGVSLEEITAAIQLLSNAGIQGEMAGTTLRGMLLSLTAPSAEAAAQLKALGVRVADEQGNVRSLAEIIGDLERGLAGKGTAERLAVLGTIFPARQAAGAAELISQGAERLAEATAALGDAQGTAGRIAGTQLDTLKGDFIILTSALEGFAIAVAEAFGEELRGAIRGVTQILNVLSKWAEANTRTIVTVVAVIAGMIALGATLVVTGLAISILATAIGGLVVALKIVGAVLGFIFSPAIVVVAAIAALAAGIGYLVYQSGLAQKALEFLGEKFQVAKAFAMELFDALRNAVMTGNFEAAGRVLQRVFQVAWEFVRLKAIETFVAIRDFALGVWHDDLLGNLRRGWILAMFQLEEIWINTVGAMQDAWTLLESVFPETFATMQRNIEAVGDLWTLVNSQMKAAFLDVAGFVGARLAGLAKHLTGLGKLFARLTGKNIDRELADVEQANRLGPDRQTAESVKSELDKRLAGNRAERDKQLEELGERRADALAALEQELANERAQREARGDAQVSDAERRLADALRELREAIDAARASSTPGGAPGGAGGDGGSLPGLPGGPADLEERIAAGVRAANTAVELSSGEGQKAVLDALVGRRDEAELLSVQIAETKKLTKQNQRQLEELRQVRRALDFDVITI